MSIEWACFVSAGEPVLAAEGAAAFVCDQSALNLEEVAGVVLPAEGETRAVALLEAGATRVFVGEAALADAGVVARLAERFGSSRVGVYMPARRMAVRWSFETVSNADFKVVTPSVCEPCWEILRSDGSASGTRVHWWVQQMIERGASAALLRVDLHDDADLNLCAGLVEELGERLWLGPLTHNQPALSDWVAYGKLTRIMLPPALFVRREELLPPSTEPQPASNQEAA
ncbi:hypothetical protein B4966_04625 [Rhodocyclaceae bacterium]|jgi:hypothetical protein|nr:hypothetical protein B4966_04625 [Rhodocyclaceae bacterium]